VDLEVALERALPRSSRPASLCRESVVELGDRAPESLGDRGEVLLVGGDQVGVALGGEAVGKVECAGGHGHGGSVRRGRPAILRHHRGLAARPPLSYKLRVEGN
jgi:hypothetical protein